MTALKTIILYRSKHHGNTKKVVDAIAAAYPGVDTVDVATLGKNEYPDVSGYHLVGAASGIYYGGMDKDLKRVLEHVLQPQDQVFGLITYGGNEKWHGRDLAAVCQVRFANLQTIHGCLGYDTFGPFKLVGGMNKGRPNAEDIQGAVDFYGRLERDYGDIFIEQYERRTRERAWEKAHPRGGLVAGIKRSVKKIAGKVGGKAGK